MADTGILPNISKLNEYIRLLRRARDVGGDGGGGESVSRNYYGQITHAYTTMLNCLISALKLGDS